MPSLSVVSIVDEIAGAASISPAVAEQAAGIILSVLAQELDPASVSAIFSKIPGAQALASAHPVSATSGGLFSGIAGAFLGQKAGAAAAGIEQLRACDLSLNQIELAANALVKNIRASGGSKLAEKVATILP